MANEKRVAPTGVVGRCHPRWRPAGSPHWAGPYFPLESNVWVGELPSASVTLPYRRFTRAG